MGRFPLETFGTRVVVVLQRYNVPSLSADGVNYALDSVSADNREAHELDQARVRGPHE
jgi:hypothetical protein